MVEWKQHRCTSELPAAESLRNGSRAGGSAGPALCSRAPAAPVLYIDPYLSDSVNGFLGSAARFPRRSLR